MYLGSLIQVIPPPVLSVLCADLKKAKGDFMACVWELHDCKCIMGDMPPIEDLLDPPEEQEDVDSKEMDHWSEGDKGYVEQRWDATGQMRLADVDEEEEEEPYKVNYSKVLEATRFLSEVCTNHGDFDNSFDLGKYLQRFTEKLIREQEDSKQQVNIDS
ncbi:hypothetical protein VKT23_011930 [Stygiomarasmius scandens]|uniref:Uncharacterized protein n=1 Tax=Marasmiellus scandens TaxID=2682957 RepID=A0ABR1J7D2_9AGAR